MSEDKDELVIKRLLRKILAESGEDVFFVPEVQEGGRPTNHSPKGALIEHLSSEVEANLNHAVRWRTGSAFTVWIGPFLVAGAVILSDSGLNMSALGAERWSLGILGIIYLCLGLIGGAA